MENYNKLYDISDRKRKSINKLFVTQNLKYISDYKVIMSKYTPRVSNCDFNIFYKSESYRRIKESIDMINLCTDYMNGKDKYQLIEIFDYLKEMRKLGYEILDIYKDFSEKFLKSYDTAIKKIYDNFIIDFIVSGKLEDSKLTTIITADHDVKKLVINHKIIKLMKDDIFKV